MLTSLPVPVLSVAADAVRELEGSDALSSLWTLFSKCKESLQDGRRLENISWRLWYRELLRTSPSRHLNNYEDENLVTTDYVVVDEKSYSPLTPDGSFQLSSPIPSDDTQGTEFFTSPVTPQPQMETRSAYSSPKLPVVQSSPSMSEALAHPIARRTPSSVRRGSFNSLNARTNVGRIICDILPNQETPPTHYLSHSCIEGTPSIAGHAPTLRPTHCNIPTQHISPSSSCLPTPGIEDTVTFKKQASSSPSPLELELGSFPSLPLITPPTPTDPINSTSQVHVSPHSEEKPAQQSPSSQTAQSPPLLVPVPPPRLVVVNPTPNPTPHPTPPATPVLYAQTLGNQSLHPHVGQFLKLPGPGEKGNLLPVPNPTLRVRVTTQASLDVQVVQGSDIEVSFVNAETGSIIPEDSVPAGMSRLGVVPEERPPETNLASGSQEHRPSVPHRHSISSTTTTTSSSSRSSEPSVTSQPTTADEQAFSNPEYEVSKGAVPPTLLMSSTVKRSPTSSDGPTFSQKRTVQSPKSTSAKLLKRHSMPVSTTQTSLSNATTTVASSLTSTGIGSPRGQPGAVSLVRRTSSGGASSTSGKSRSRTRSREAAGVLAMTSARGKVVGGRPAKSKVLMSNRPLVRGRGGVVRKQSQDEGAAGNAEGSNESEMQKQEEQDGARKRERERCCELEREAVKDRDGKKAAKFNIGSNSDEGSGMGSKSAGSGSDVSGVGKRGQQSGTALTKMMRGEDATWKGKERERAYQEQQMMMYDERQKENERSVDRKRQEKDAAVLVAAAAAKIEKSLAEPLLPQQQRRMIVLATSESDYETDSDDDGSWSSEELSTGYVDVALPSRQASSQQQKQPSQTQLQPRVDPQPQQQQHQPQHAPHLTNTKNPVGPQLSHPQTLAPTNVNNTTTNHATRAKQHRVQQRQAQANAHALFEQAAAEAQRQRDMFAKRPTESFQNLNDASRTRSVGLLTQLLNPDPQIFPVNHPYRRGFSSGEFRHGGSGAHGGQVSKQADPEMAVMAPPLHQQRKSMPPMPSTSRPTLFSRKSTTAVPVSSQVQVGSQVRGVVPDALIGAAPNDKGASNGVNGSNGVGWGYRPKGRPQDQVLEDDSDSEADVIQLSSSVAQEKLKAFAEKRGISRKTSESSGLPGPRADDNEVPVWAREQNPPHARVQPAPAELNQAVNDYFNTFNNVNHSNATPIPFVHPYNLPLPAPPSTPRTTRRLMLRKEMSESLRRNLLWERQVSKTNLVPLRKSPSVGANRNNLLGGLQPLTTTPSMVQLTAKGSNNQEGPPANPDRERRGSGGAGTETEQEREERRRRAMARNRSWAEDYHYAGW